VAITVKCFQNEKKIIVLWKKKLLAIIRGITKWRLVLLHKPFKILTDNQAVVTFVKQALDNIPHMQKLHK